MMTCEYCWDYIPMIHNIENALNDFKETIKKNGNMNRQALYYNLYIKIKEILKE